MASSGSILLANKAFFTFILMVCYQAFILPWQPFERISALGPSQDTQLNWWPIFQQDTASSSENNRAPTQVSKCFWLEQVDAVFSGAGLTVSSKPTSGSNSSPHSH